MAGTCTTAHSRILPLLHWRRHAPARAHACSRVVHRVIAYERFCYTRNTTPNTNAPAHARAHSRLIPRVIAQERRYYTRHATRTAPAALGPLRATAHTRRRFSYAWPHKPLPPPAVASPHARAPLFLFRVPTLFSAGRFFILLAARCAASACQHARARSALRHAGIAPRCIAPCLRAHVVLGVVLLGRAGLGRCVRPAQRARFPCGARARRKSLPIPPEITSGTPRQPPLDGCPLGDDVLASAALFCGGPRASDGAAPPPKCLTSDPPVATSVKPRQDTTTRRDGETGSWASGVVLLLALGGRKRRFFSGVEKYVRAAMLRNFRAVRTAGGARLACVWRRCPGGCGLRRGLRVKKG